MTEILPFLQLWGKIDAQGKVHPLVCHLIDVSQVALAIWENVLTKSARAHMARALGLSDMGEAGLLFAYWAGLHDLGKASPSFQGNPRRVSSEIREDAKTRLKAFGFDFPQVVGQVGSHHGSITTRTLPDLLVERTGLSAELARLVASSVGGHHGVWPTDHELYLHAGPRAIGKGLWDDARRWLVARLDELMNSPRVPEQVKVGPTANTLMTALSGLTSVADWVGSMEAYFQTGDRSADLASEDLVGYAEVSRVNALRALDETGWLCRQPPALSCSFQDLFKIAAPYPLQQSIIELAPTLDRPCLVIIEAPTGIGKTEAALYLADNWTRSQSRTGLYVAMPTMATSDQMYGRVKEFLLRRYPGSLSNYHLLHGNAALRDDDQVPRLSVVEDGVDHKGTVAALEWFTARKRGLLAPFAVGTVDQSLMGVLQTPHFFVRLFGLAHKTIVFDEVHAYDTYMDELLRLLLRWLRALDASVIILSATLPEKTRRSLVEAYSGNASLAIQNANYPRITWAMEDKTDSVSLPSPPERTIELAHIGRDPREITSFLSTKLSGGGCAAVICNTVARAQEVFQSIRDSCIVPEEHLILFHSRFPASQREEIQRKVLRRYDKEGGDRPGPGQASVVVATQVIEQSLDLDFDLVVSDLAPVDLVIQRAGRLHRHERQVRPETLRKPCLVISMPPVVDSLPAFSRADRFVYDHYVLLRTFFALRASSEISVPGDVQSLISLVYGDSLPEALGTREAEALAKAKEALISEQRQAAREALSKLISRPDDPDLFSRSNAGLEEDDPTLSRYRRAATRLAPPSITIVCLHGRADGLHLTPEAQDPVVNVEQKPDMAITKALLNQKIQVSDRRLVTFFGSEAPPCGWTDNAWLRHARLAVFDEKGECQLKRIRIVMTLDPELGLRVSDEEGE